MTPFEFKPGSRWRWVSLAGPDAADFLHRLTTVNVRSLAVGQGAEGFFLTAQGKIRSRFTLWRLAADAFGFEVDGGAEGTWLKELLAVIDQFTFAERFELRTEPLEPLWILAAPLGGLSAGETRELAPGVRACHRGDADYGVSWISLWAPAGEDLGAWNRGLAHPKPAEAAAWLERSRIAALSPAPDRELTADRNPLELGLRAGVADNKGCYPGQEVIEKIISLGAPSRRLTLLQGQGSLEAVPAGLKIYGSDQKEIGQVTSVVEDDSGGFIALGLVSKTQAQENANVQLGSSPDSASAAAKILKVAPYA